MECRVATTFDWEWGPSALQRLGNAQALCVYIHTLHYITLRYITLHYIPYHTYISYVHTYITLHLHIYLHLLYITLHYINYIHYIHYIHTCFFAYFSYKIWEEHPTIQHQVFWCELHWHRTWCAWNLQTYRHENLVSAHPGRWKDCSLLVTLMQSPTLLSSTNRPGSDICFV